MENGFMNKIIGVVLVLVIGATLVGGLLMPTVGAIQTNIGDEITKTNDNYYHYSYELTDTPVEFKMTVGENNARTYSINGESYTQTMFSSINSIVTDSLIVQVPKEDTTSSWGYTYVNSEGTETVVYTSSGNSGLLFENGKIYTIDSSDNKTEIGSYSWIIYNNNTAGQWVLTTQSTVSEFYINGPQDIIAGGYYKTGELDTYYTFKEGVAKSSNTDYTAKAVYDKALTDGTTDIYTITNFAIEISDGTTTESFVPYWFFVKETITGHENSGAFYTMFGVIGLLGIVLLVTIAASAVRSKY